MKSKRADECRISLNGLKRYADSNEAFELSLKYGIKEKSVAIWIAKNAIDLARG